MSQWQLATLTDHQYQAIRDLEERLGLTLIAYTSQEAAGGAPVDFAGVREPDGERAALSALNETYRSGVTP